MKPSIKQIINKLDKSGYCIVKNILSKKACSQIKLSIENTFNKIKLNKFFKDEVSKQGQVVIRDLILLEPKKFLPLLNISLIHKVLPEIFNEKYILDNFMASNSIKIKNKYKALVHIDSHLPAKEIKNTSDVVVLLCLDEFTKENGCTKIWPGSHKSGIRIQNEKKSLPKKKYLKYVEAPEGSIVFFLGQSWHQIGKNVNNNSRWGILIHFKRWWIKPSTDFTKCGPKIFKVLNKKQKELLGFTSISPKFNFKIQTKELKTLRKYSSLGSNYFKVIRY